jgi:hypothetical protein
MTNKWNNCGCVCNFVTFGDQYDSELHFQETKMVVCPFKKSYVVMSILCEKPHKKMHLSFVLF